MWNILLGDETPDGDFEEGGFGLGGQVPPEPRQELLKSPHLETSAAFKDNTGQIRDFIYVNTVMVIFLIIVSTSEQLNEKWLTNMMRPVK